MGPSAKMRFEWRWGEGRGGVGSVGSVRGCREVLYSVLYSNVGSVE